VDAVDLARRFALDGPARLSDGPVARGKQGVVWRLETADGSWAVKVPFGGPTEEEVRPATTFHEAAHAAGVPTPRVRRTTDGHVFATVDGTRARVYEWVDLLAPDTRLDPARVGAVVAAVHQVPIGVSGTLDPWYREPVGAERWDALVEELRRAGAPFAGRLAGLRDELVALESWIEPPELLRTCHRDLWADNLLPTADGDVCVIDWENSGPADPSQELGCVLFEFARTDLGLSRLPRWWGVIGVLQWVLALTALLGLVLLAVRYALSALALPELPTPHAGRTPLPTLMLLGGLLGGLLVSTIMRPVIRIAARRKGRRAARRMRTAVATVAHAMVIGPVTDVRRAYRDARDALRAAR